jgi:hypothetical protein
MEPTAVAFRGVRGDHTRRIEESDWSLNARVLVEDVFGVETDIPWHLEEVSHSPTGPEWGYGGSGPAQLAYCILREFLPADEARALYQKYKREVVAALPQNAGWTLTADQVKEWITCSKSQTI